MRKYALLILSILFASIAKIPAAALNDAPETRIYQEAGKKVDLPFFKENEEIPEALRLKTFDVVWEKIRDDYYDPTFNGLDWNNIHETYQPKVLRTKKSGEFHALLRQMLAELKRSHLAVFAPHQMRSKKPAELRLTVDGVDLRKAGDRIIIYSVKKGTPAWLAGLRPGYVLLTVDGESLEEMTRDFSNSSDPALQKLKAARKALSGDPSVPTKLTVLDENDREKVIPISRTIPEKIKALNLAKGTLDFRRVHPKIGYLRFDAWTMDLKPKLESALNRLRDADGIILDLRQNPGGIGDPADFLAGAVSREKGIFGIEKRRNKESSEWTYPGSGDSAYQGRIVILVDERTGSVSEVFTAGLQECGRAIVIGYPSAGGVLPSTQHLLPSGGIMMFPHSDFLTPKGNHLEGKGVIPDVPLELERCDLLKGKDSLVEKAIEIILRQDEISN